MTNFLRKGYSFDLLCVSFTNVYQCVCVSFLFGFEDGMMDLIVLAPDRYLSFNFVHMNRNCQNQMCVMLSKLFVTKKTY